MPSVRSVVVLSAVALFLVLAPSASAAHGCDAPPGIAAVDQYCDTLPAAGGATDPSGKHVPRLVSKLPPGLAKQLRQHGILGEVLLALPAADANGMAVASHRAVANGRRVRFDASVDPLLPGPASNARAVVRAATSAGDVNREMGWALGATLFGLAALALWGTLRRV